MIRTVLIGLVLIWLGKPINLLGQETKFPTKNLPVCRDTLDATATIDQELDDEFFASVTSSYPWYVVDHGEGRLEDTLDGRIDPGDRVKVEHSAHCISTHQGTHLMEFSEASSDAGTTTLKIWGGLPAYASSLTLTISPELKVSCCFDASYPGPSEGLSWRITKKSIRLRDRDVEIGKRMYGWLSVEFEERSEQDGRVVWTAHKIEGYFKPVLRKSGEPETPDQD